MTNVLVMGSGIVDREAAVGLHDEANLQPVVAVRRLDEEALVPAGGHGRRSRSGCGLSGRRCLGACRADKDQSDSQGRGTTRDEPPSKAARGHQRIATPVKDEDHAPLSRGARNPRQSIFSFRMRARSVCGLIAEQPRRAMRALDASVRLVEGGLDVASNDHVERLDEGRRARLRRDGPTTRSASACPARGRPPR